MEETTSEERRLRRDILTASARAVDGVQIQPLVSAVAWGRTPEARAARQLAGLGLGVIVGRCFTISDASPCARARVDRSHRAAGAARFGARSVDP